MRVELLNEKLEINLDVVRTLSIVDQLAQGKILILPNGERIAMGKDMCIGIAILWANGDCTISGLSTMDLRQLNQLLTKHEIGMAIPKWEA